MVTKDQMEFPSLLQEGAQPPQSESVRHLQRKLKVAAKKILSLSLEKEQLLEMGNRLRAEQGLPKGRYLGKAGGPGHTGVMPMERGSWCHGSATGGQKKKLPGLLATSLGPEGELQAGFTEATGGGPEPTRRLRHRAGLHLSTGCPLTHCSGHIWKEQPQSS